MVIHYSLMLVVFLFISFFVQPFLLPLPDTKLTMILSLIVYGIVFFIGAKVVVKLSMIISDGVFLEGMPNWKINDDNQIYEDSET